MKLVLLGDGGVGKTSIRRSYMGKGFVSNHLMQSMHDQWTPMMPVMISVKEHKKK